MAKSLNRDLFLNQPAEAICKRYLQTLFGEVFEKMI